nr:MAG TPA: repressor protein CI [Caudoviricetes sp.]
MKKNINPQVIDIQRRFFEAISMAKELGRTTGLKSFCEEHNLNLVKYYRIKGDLGKTIEEMHYKAIDIDALAYVCLDFGVPPDWLLLGKGKLKIR